MWAELLIELALVAAIMYVVHVAVLIAVRYTVHVMRLPDEPFTLVRKRRSEKPVPEFNAFEKWLLGKRSASGRSQTPVGKYPPEQWSSGQPDTPRACACGQCAGLSTCPRAGGTCPRAALAPAPANPLQGGQA